jgi:hypothetical protein
MQMRTIVLAAALTVSATAAFAQAGGNNAGATVPEKSGSAVNGGAGAVGTVDNGQTTREGTIGMSPAGPSARARMEAVSTSLGRVARE